MTTPRRKVIIDCDTGVDDALALVLCLKNLEVVGITTVGGNVGLASTQRNTRYVTEVTGYTHVPVFAGCDRPMLEPLRDASYVHGAGGLGPIEVPEPKKPLESRHGVDYLIETYMAHDDITLITLGPLTNVAHALLREPRLAGRIPEILCMGGSATFGNATPAAEFNIYTDPEAAKIVFESGIPIRMVGLNLTREQRVTPALMAAAEAIDNDVARMVARLCGHVLDRSGGTGSFCDACAVMWLVEPAVITKSLKFHVTVETRGEFTRGMTVCDTRPYAGAAPGVDIDRQWQSEPSLPGKAPNVEVAMDLDQEKFNEVLLDTLRRYSET